MESWFFFLWPQNQVKGAESSKPAVTSHRLLSELLRHRRLYWMFYRCGTFGKLANRVMSALLECAIYWKRSFLHPPLFYFLLIMCSWSPNAVFNFNFFFFIGESGHLFFGMKVHVKTSLCSNKLIIYCFYIIFFKVVFTSSSFILFEMFF